MLPVVVDSLDVSIRADVPGAAVLTEQLQILNASAGDDVIITGLVLHSGILVQDCAGPIHVQDCDAVRNSSVAAVPPLGNFWEVGLCGVGGSTQSVMRSTKVTFTGCTFEGRHGGPAGIDGGPGDHGLRVEASKVALYSCQLLGGTGYIGGQSGGHGPFFSGSGGDGLRVVGAGSTVDHRDLTVLGGPGAPAEPTYPNSLAGCDGIDIRADTGSDTTAITQPDLTLVTPDFYRGSQAVQIQVEGAPGATVALLSSARAGWRPLGPLTGNLHIANPLRVTHLGVIPPSGTLHQSVVGVDSALVGTFFNIHYQAIAFHQGRRYLSQPRRVTNIASSL